MPGTTVYSIAETNWFQSDEAFSRLLAPELNLLSRRHWTPLKIARKAALYLAADKNCRILDVGSGVGKFCLSAAYYAPDAFFTGIEQRGALVEQAETMRRFLRLDNVDFHHGNFTQVDFSNFDHFYFFNSFYENLCGTDKIDDSILYSCELYNYYNRYFFKQLEQKPDGTRLVTYHSSGDEVPPCYHEVGSEDDNQLKFWIKA